MNILLDPHYAALPYNTVQYSTVQLYRSEVSEQASALYDFRPRQLIFSCSKLLADRGATAFACAKDQDFMHPARPVLVDISVIDRFGGPRSINTQYGDNTLVLTGNLWKTAFPS